MAVTKKPWRETPLVETAALSRAARCRIFLKLENLQPSGSFKSRGIGNCMLAHLERQGNNVSDQTHFYSSSGGNAGLACVTAARSLNHPATVVVPMSTNPLMIAKLKAAGAHEVIQHGASWREADTYLKQELLTKNPHGVYMSPFDHPDIWTGNATVVDEITWQLPALLHKAAGRSNGFSEEKPDAIICSVGGGGLFAGIMQGLEEAGWADVPVIAVETEGAASLRAALDAEELVTLPAITSLATSLGAARVAQQAFEYGKRRNVRSVVLSDAEAAMGCWRLADDERVMVELASGVNAALCYDGRLEMALGKPITKDTKVIIILCGGSNVTVDMLAQWRQDFAFVERQVRTPNAPSSHTAPA
jgi:L-serine/L-threonine ammonia-lyase